MGRGPTPARDPDQDDDFTSTDPVSAPPGHLPLDRSPMTVPPCRPKDSKPRLATNPLKKVDPIGSTVTLLVGIALGFSLAAPPGPMNALIAREASSRGSQSGIRVGLGGPTADMIFLAIFVIGLGGLMTNGGWIRLGALIGSILMGWFALTTLVFSKNADGRLPTEATFLTGLLAALTNPYQIAWWISGGFVLLHSQGLWGITGFIVGVFGWVLLFPWLVAHGAQRWKWFQSVIKWSSALLLGVFSLLLLTVAVGLLEL